MLTFHNDLDDIIKKLLSEKLLQVNFETGEVLSKRWHKPLGCLNLKGYKVCMLHLNKKRIQAKIHRIIWIASHGEITSGFVIDHINGNKSDNRLCNLRLADHILNSNNRRNYKGSNNPSAKINYQIANKIRKQHVALKSYSKVANLFNLSRSLIAQIVRRELWV